MLRSRLAVFLIVGTAVGAVYFYAHAATGPFFLITWKTGTYVPSTYTGKALPIPHSPVTVSFDVIRDGKPVNLSQNLVYWYLDDELIQSGRGIQQITVTAPEAPQRSMDVRVELPDYGNGSLLETVTIPVVQPKIVIDAPYPSGRFTANAFGLSAAPYYFNIHSPAELALQWIVNDAPVSSDGDRTKLTVAMGDTAKPGSTFDVRLNAKNPRIFLEGNSSEITLTYTQ